MTARLLCLLALTAAAVSASQLRGRVLDAADGRPLPSADVELAPVESGGSPQAARTGADGSFAIHELAPGEYRATFHKAGYEGRSRHTEPVRIAAENERISLTVKLWPSPVIAGQVTDADGEPVPKVAIQLMQWRSIGGVRTLQPADSARTDDVGRFRLFDLRPGRYFLLASPPPAAATPGDALYDLSAQYYPGVDSATSAAPLLLDWGTAFEQADIELSPAPDTSLIGSAWIAGAGPCAKCQVMLEALDSGFQVGLQPNEGGSFRVFGLQPGRYRALARNRGPGIAFAQVEQTRGRPAELLLELSEGATISGRFELEHAPEQSTVDAEPGLTEPGRNRRRGVRLTRLPSLSGERYESQIDGANLFVVNGVPAGEYLVTPFEAPDGGYVASISANGAPLPDWRLRVGPGATSTELALRVAFDGGRISGAVAGHRDAAAADRTVVLLPFQYGGGRGGFEHYAGLAGPDGAFEFAGVPPGTYGLAAVRRNIGFDWADPEQRARFHDGAKTIRVGPRSSQQAEAPLLEDFR